MPDLPDDLAKYMKSIGAKPGAADSEDAPGTSESTLMSGLKGVGQGVLGYVEAPAQLAEQGIRKVTGNEQFKLPLHDWAAEYKRGVESTTSGQVGEAIGSTLPMFLPAGWFGLAGRGAAMATRGLRGAQEIPSFLGAAGKGAEAVGATERFLPTLAKGAAGGALSQPVSGDNFAHEKLQQMIAGAALGGMAKGIGNKLFSSEAERLAASKAGFTSPRAQRAAEKQTQRAQQEAKAEFDRNPFGHMGKNQPQWAKDQARAAKAKDTSVSSQLKKLGPDLFSHYVMHHIPGLNMFSRWHAAKALADIIRQGKIPSISPEMQATFDRMYGRIPYRPDEVPYVWGAQADRYYPQEEGQ